MADKKTSTQTSPYFEKGIEAYTQGAYEYAIDLLTYVIKQTPDATEARRYLRLAIQKRDAEQPPSQLTLIGLMIFTFPVQLWAQFNIIQGKTRQAIVLYERLLNLMPRSKQLLMHLAVSLNKAGLPDASFQTYEELLNVDPNHVGALRQLARLAMKRGNDAKARECFERITKLHPGDAEAQQSMRNLDALGTIKKGFTA